MMCQYRRSYGVSKSGNERGLTAAEVAGLEPQALQAGLAQIEERMRQAGAHAVVETIADLPGALDAIEGRLRHGEQP